MQPSEPDLRKMLGQSDAAVIIGDAALKFMEGNEQPDAEKQKEFLKLSPEPLLVFDMVERWKLLTGLPFVFAFWAARPGFDDRTVVDLLKASRVFGVPQKEVTPEMRERCKMVNYGIAYGMSAFGLAQRLGIPRKQAAEIIDHYFAQFPSIRKYMADTVEFARQHGYQPDELVRIINDLA